MPKVKEIKTEGTVALGTMIKIIGKKPPGKKSTSLPLSNKKALVKPSSVKKGK